MSSTFGKFRLYEHIGGGRLSEVYRVAPGVALKRVMPSVATDESFVQLIVREAGLMTRIVHPNLCSCHEMGVVDGAAFLTLDLVDGCTLRALMRRISQQGIVVSDAAILALGRQLAGVLDYLHRAAPRPLMHLDLSPQNVMITRDGVIKLIDFGIARYVDGRDAPPLAGRIAGTIGYMSPEQASAREPLDVRADQYGLGVLLWELAWAERLFRGNTPETWQRMRSGTLLDVPVAVAPEAGRSRALRAVILTLLRAEAGQRFSTMAGAYNAMSSVGGNGDGQASLAALVAQLLADPSFDRFDAVNLRPRLQVPEPHDAEIPTGEADIDGYEELVIAVDHGDDTPAAQVRAVLPEAVAPAAALAKPCSPSSPFLEMVAG